MATTTSKEFRGAPVKRSDIAHTLLGPVYEIDGEPIAKVKSQDWAGNLTGGASRGEIVISDSGDDAGATRVYVVAAVGEPYKMPGNVTVGDMADGRSPATAWCRTLNLRLVYSTAQELI